MSDPLGYKSTVTEGFYHKAFGWISPYTPTVQDITEVEQRIENYENTISVTEETVHVGYNDENTNVILGNGEPNSTTTIKSEHLNVGRYIYLNSKNDYSGETDSGLVMNIHEADEKKSITGFTSDTIEVDEENGLIAGQIIAVQSALNTGLYQVKTHVDGVITIETSPEEPFLKSSLNPESANGNVCPVFVQLIRANSGGESEYAHGDVAPLEYHGYLYDEREESTLGDLEITEAVTFSSGENQLVFNTGEILPSPSKETVITVDEGEEDRTLTVPSTASDDTFAFLDEAQTMKNKTMTDKTNNVLARGLFVNNGDANVSTYSASAPTTNQFLKAGSSSTASWTDVKLSAGNSIELNGSKSEANLGTGTVSISVKFDEEQDETERDETLENPTPSTQGEFPGVPSPGLGLPGIPGLPGITAAVAAAVAGVLAAGAVAAGAVAAGEVRTDKIKNTENDDVATINNDGDVTFHNDVTIEGDLTVLGTTTSVSSNNISLDSRYMYLNSTDNVNSPKSTGLITTNYPGATEYTLDNFVAGSGGTPAQCDITPDTGLSAGDFIQVWSTDPGYTGSNKGIYEVLTCGSGVLQVKGFGTTTIENYTRNDFETDAVNSLSGIRIVLNGIEFNDSGFPRFLWGNNTGTMTREFLAYHNSNVEFLTTTTDVLAVDTIQGVTGGIIHVSDTLDCDTSIKVNSIVPHSGDVIVMGSTGSHTVTVFCPLETEDYVQVGTNLYASNIHEKPGVTGINLQDDVYLKSVSSIAEENYTILCKVDTTDKVIKISPSSLTDVIGTGLSSVNSYTNNAFAWNEVQFDVTELLNGYCILSLKGFNFTVPSDINNLSLGSSNEYNQYRTAFTPIYLTINSVFEECLLILDTTGQLSIIRKTGMDFPESGVVKHGQDDYVLTGAKLLTDLHFFNDSA